jgi:hypothetical protein
MRGLMLSIAMAIGVAFGAGDVSACQSNADCDQGSHCETQQGMLDGVCVNDVAPTPIDEQETVETPTIDDDGPPGNECVSSDECGVGGRCVKPAGAISGFCTGGM